MTVRKGRAPSLIDLYVARRLRQRRLALHLSQEVVAEGLEITVQQLQKYEHGANRLSARRLIAISSILETPAAHFYAGAETLRLVRLKRDDVSLMLDICDLLIAWTDAESDVGRLEILQLVQGAVRGQQLKERGPLAFLPRPVRTISPPPRRREPDRASAGW